MDYCHRAGEALDPIVLCAYIWPLVVFAPISIRTGVFHPLLGYHGNLGLHLSMPSGCIFLGQKHTWLLY